MLSKTHILIISANSFGNNHGC